MLWWNRSGCQSPTRFHILLGALLKIVVNNHFVFCRGVLSFQHRLHHRGLIQTPDGIDLIGASEDSATELSSEFRVVAKRPARLVRDPKTGFYRPERNANKETPDVKERDSGLWNTFKAALFGTVDGIGALRGKTRNFANLRVLASSESVFDGYKQVQERVYETRGSPGKRLLQEYEQRGGMSQVLETDTNVAANTKPRIFGLLKRGNKATVEPSRVGLHTAGKNQGPIDTFKPVVVKSFAASPEVRESWQDLLSPNPVRKAIARFRVEEWDRKERNIEAEITRYRKSRLVKEFVYSMGDAAQASARYMIELPERVASISDRISGFLISLSDKIQQTRTAIVSIPAQVDRKSIEVQKSIENGIALTKKVVQDVVEIPGRIKRTTEATKESAIAFAGALDDAVIQCKVLVRLEKPVPRPPILPPPPDLTIEEIGWRVAGGLAKAAWWVTKGVAVLTWTGTSYAAQKGIKTLAEQNWQRERAPEESFTTPVTPIKAAEQLGQPSNSEHGLLQPFKFLSPTQKSVATTAAKKEPAQSMGSELESPATRDDDLDRQVEEALKLAEEALRLVAKEEDLSS
jgi:hypothetical protein